jgi:hypothetical protein
MNNKNIYRLIKPYQSDKVYEATTTMHGAGKCYQELKKNNVNCSSFTIMNLDDNSMYDFKIHEKPQMILKENDKINELLNKNKLTQYKQHKQQIQNGGTMDDIDDFKNILRDLSKRIKILEDKINIK